MPRKRLSRIQQHVARPALAAVPRALDGHGVAAALRIKFSRTHAYGCDRTNRASLIVSVVADTVGDARVCVGQLAGSRRHL